VSSNVRRPARVCRGKKRIFAAERVLARQDGPTVLVGHSFSGMIVTEAGLHPNVSALSIRRSLSRRRQDPGFPGLFADWGGLWSAASRLPSSFGRVLAFSLRRPRKNFQKSEPASIVGRIACDPFRGGIPRMHASKPTCLRPRPWNPDYDLLRTLPAGGSCFRRCYC
jgi:hypothetical protein